MFEQVKGVVKELQTSIMALLAKTVNNVSLKTLTIPAKRLILDIGWFKDVFLQISISYSLKFKQPYVKMEDKKG